MTSPSSILVTPGVGKIVATYSISESAQTKELQRIVASDSAGNEIDPISISSSLNSNTKSVTTSGTAVRIIGSSTPCKNVVICAFISNTGVIAVGGSNVKASLTNTLIGIPLYAGDTISLDINDATNIWIDATVNTEGISFIYLN